MTAGQERAGTGLPPPSPGPGAGKPGSWALDMYETDGNLGAVADIPGRGLS